MKSFNERIQEVTRGGWTRAGIWCTLYIAFVIWVAWNDWFSLLWLLLLPLIADAFTTKYINWSWWRKYKPADKGEPENPQANSLLYTICSWIDAIVFALVAVYFINIYIFQNYQIPRFFCDYTLFAVYPNDPFFPMQYALHNIGQTFTDNHTGTIDADINAPEAWEITMGDSCIVIAVIDEGVTSNHPDLPNSRQIRLAGSNFGSGDPDDPSPTWNDAHGTCCAGAIAATTNNNEGIAGIAPNCKIMPIRVENGTSVPSENQIANAFAFAINNGANIISCSLGFDNKYNQPNAFPDIVNKIQEAIDAGICVILAAGNNSECGDNKVAFPANCNVNYKITVGASDRYDQRACYSPINSKIDIVAPSHRAYPSQIATENLEIWALDIPGFYGYNPDKTTYEKLPDSGNNYLAYTGRFGGTSYSCPTVAGVAALMLSVNPDLSPQEVYTILTQTADKVGGYTYTNGRCNEMGYGRLDAYTAVLAARNKYIQNVTYSNGSNVVEIYPNIYAGYAVTNNKPYGNVVVQVGSNVTFKARNRIELHPGFRVEQGATFRAVIESPSQQSSAPSYVRRKELFTANNEEDNHDDAVIEQPQKNTFSISPNPVRDILNIHISEELSQVKIYNLNGQCVLRANQMDIDVSALPQGMYILRTETTSGAPLQAKFIKQ